MGAIALPAPNAMRSAMRIARTPVHAATSGVAKIGNSVRSLNKFADGGSSDSHGARAGELVHIGPIKSHVKGRTDHIEMSVPHGSFVIPADVVSGLGQGNSDAGHLELQKRLHLTQFSPEYAKGGAVPIMAAGGEHVIGPRDVTRLGNGNLEAGHKRLDAFVVRERKKIVKTMRKLPGPKKD